MTAMPKAKMLRWSGIGTLALAVGAPAALAQVAAAGTMAGRVMITTRDSATAAERMVVLRLTPHIDSLIRKLNSLPIGTPEALAVDSALQAAFKDLPQPTGFAGSNARMRVEISSPRAALRASAMDVVPQGTMGFTAVGVNRSWYDRAGAFIQYFEYPTVVAIETNSPASRAGIRSGDSLVAYDGHDVRQFAINMTELLTPGRDVSVRLRRDGEPKDVVVTVDKAPPGLMSERRSAVADMMAVNAVFERRLTEARARSGGDAPLPPGVVRKSPTAAAGAMTRASVASTPMGMPSGVLGAAMTSVDADLANSLRGMKGKRGVLVTQVPEGSIAGRSGLRSGDVILRVEAADVSSVPEFRVRLGMAEQNGMERVKMTVLRGGKTLELYYTPPR